MTIDDIFDELDELESDADLASAVAIGTRGITSIDTSRQPGVAREMAKTVSGFRLIPENLLTEEILIDGMRHMNAKQTQVHASDDMKENYRQAALKKLENGELFLAAFNYDLVDKRMILQTLATSSFGDNKSIERAKSSEIDDEVALSSLQKGGNITAIFAHPAASNFHEETWKTALLKDDLYLGHIRAHGLAQMLESIIASGYWPKKEAGLRPLDAKSAITDRASQKDGASIRSFVLNALIRTFPMDEVLPCLKTSARAKIREQIFTTDELRPHMKQFPFLKAAVLESDLGF